MNSTSNNYAINEIAIVENLSHTPEHVATITWRGKQVYALYIPQTSKVPNTHPNLLSANNNDYDTSFQVANELCAELGKNAENGVSLNGGCFMGCSGDVTISNQYLFDFDTHRLHDKENNFSYCINNDEKIMIIKIKSNFIKKNKQPIPDSPPPSYESLYGNSVQ